MTTKPSPILCGTDFSPNADRAATVAAILAARSGATLLLVHIAEGVLDLVDSESQVQAYLGAMETRLEGEAQRLRQFGATVEVCLRHTEGYLPEQMLMQISEERTPSLAIISSVSKTAFDRWSLGSVSEHFSGHAPIPTLVVRSAVPFEAWAKGERPLRVFVAANFGSISATAIQWAGGLRSLGPCEITLGYVDRPDHAWKRLGSAGELTYTKNPPLVQEALERNLREKARDLLGDENVKVRVEPIADRPDARLVELAAEEQADLVVVGTSQRTGLSRWWRPSVSRGVLRHAATSVACVPEAAIPLQQRPVPDMRQVLVATDFSEPGVRAVRYAHAICAPGGRVYLVHVTAPASVGELLPADAEKLEEGEATRAAALEALRGQLLALVPHPESSPHLPPGVTTEVHVLEGRDPVGAIEAAAERFGADVVCVGSHGRSGLTGALLGSVARDLMKQSHRPVLIVPPPAD